MNQNIRIILVETSLPANIGSAARAMKTMGMTDLILVNPKKFPDVRATTLASGAGDILDSALVVENLAAALVGCDLVFATSARERTFDFDLISPRAAAEKVNALKPSKVAFVFGREKNGLTNEELELAPHHIKIPTPSNYQSLNLAQAVQVICYELVVTLNQYEESIKSRDRITADEHEGLFDHLMTTLTRLKFLDPNNAKKLPTRIRALLHRMDVDKSEHNILRGVLRRIEERCDAWDRQEQK